MSSLVYDVVYSDTDDETDLLLPSSYSLIPADKARHKDTLTSITLCCGNCICCKRTTSGSKLSMKTRFSYLVRGYIRNHNGNIPNDVVLLCIRFIGGPRLFGVTKLMPLKDLGYDCCGSGTFCGQLLRQLLSVPLSVWINMFWVFTMLSAKDIAALVIASSHNCNNAMSTNTLGYLDVSAWMYIAAVINMIISAIWISVSLLADNGAVFWNCLCCNFRTWKGTVIGIVSGTMQLLTISFYIIWIVFGFILWGQMKSGLACTEMVLSWCILEIILVVLGLPCCCCFSFLLSHGPIKPDQREKWEKSWLDEWVSAPSRYW